MRRAGDSRRVRAPMLWGHTLSTPICRGLFQKRQRFVSRLRSAVSPGEVDVAAQCCGRPAASRHRPTKSASAVAHSASRRANSGRYVRMVAPTPS